MANCRTSSSVKVRSHTVTSPTCIALPRELFYKTLDYGICSIKPLRATARAGPPIRINRRHRSRIPEGEGSWADEQICHVVAGDGPSCHPERSEGSVSMSREMLRCAQHDRAVLLAIPATPDHPRPYGILDPCLRLMHMVYPCSRSLHSL